MKNRWQLVAYGLLLVLFAQIALASRHTSITLDESLHITSGYACLITGDYRLVEEHPPLLKMLQSLPLLLTQPRLPDPRDVEGWNEGDLISVAQNVIVPYRPIDRLVFAARVPTMLVGLLLAALVYRWAADVFGARAGGLALALCAFDPNILAHAGVAATDLGAACALFAGMYSFWRWMVQASGPSWRRCLAAAVVLGLALGVKTTALMLLPIYGMVILLARPSGQPLKPYLFQALVGGSMAFFILWALYRFEVGMVPGLAVLVPAPSHLLPLLKLQEHMREGHSAFLMGRNYHHGLWYYFPVAFLLKTPPLVLGLLLLTALGIATQRISRLGWRNEVALSALPVLYFATSLASGINIGYRHLLPILPFLFVWVSRLSLPLTHVASPPSRMMHRVLRFVLYASLLCYMVNTLVLFPWYLAYFNVFAGGPDGGYRYLVDSNLDWGQTWKALRKYVEEQEIREFSLSQYTINDPRAYGLDYTPLPPWPDAPPVLPRRFDPSPGIYAISTTTLQGVVVADSEMFDYFRKVEPVARIGHAMFVYNVNPHPPAEWVAQCTMPVTPLPSDVVAEGLGRTDLRMVHFDCEQSWIYPAGSGWYVLSRDYKSWGVAHARRARLAYEQVLPGFLPPFAVYEWFGLNPLEGLYPVAAKDLLTVPLYAAPGNWPPPQAMAEGTTLTGPVTVGDNLEFLGYVAEVTEVPVGGSVSIQSYWQVLKTTQEPISLMAHLLNREGMPIAVGDGLGVPIAQLRPDDIVVQRHVLEIPSESAPGAYWLQVGAYTLADIERLPVIWRDNEVGDRLLAGQIEVVVP